MRLRRLSALRVGVDDSRNAAASKMNAYLIAQTHEDQQAVNEERLRTSHGLKLLDSVHDLRVYDTLRQYFVNSNSMCTYASDSQIQFCSCLAFTVESALTHIVEGILAIRQHDIHVNSIKFES